MEDRSDEIAMETLRECYFYYLQENIYKQLTD